MKRDSTRVLIVAGNTYPVENMASDLRFNVIPLDWEWADFNLTIYEMIEQEVVAYDDQMNSASKVADCGSALKGLRPGLRFWVISDLKASSLLKTMERRSAWLADAKFRKMIKIVKALAIIEPHFMYEFDRHSDKPVNIRDVEGSLNNFLQKQEWAQLQTARIERPGETQAVSANKTDGPEMLVLRGNMFSIDDFGSSCYFNLLPFPWTQSEFRGAVTGILQQELDWHERLSAAADDPCDSGADMLIQPLGLQIWRVSDTKPASVLHYIHSSSKGTGLLGARAKWGLGFIDSLSARDPDFTYCFENTAINLDADLPVIESWLLKLIGSEKNIPPLLWPEKSNGKILVCV